MNPFEKLTVRAIKALADETRLRILRLLDTEELNVHEIQEILGMSQPRVSRHLAVLREARLIRDRREGTWVFYSRNGAVRRGEAGLLAALKESWDDLPAAQADRKGLAEVLARREERSRAHFDAEAESWETFEERFLDPALRRVALARMLPRFELLVDAGTGTGVLLPQLAGLAERVVAIDHSPKMLSRARERIEEAGIPNVELREGTLDELPLQGGSADGVFASFVLHHAPRPARAVLELSRVLRPGGTLTVTDFLPHAEEWLREEHADLRLGLDPDQVSRWLGAAGLAGVEIDDWAVARAGGRSSRIENLRVFVASARKPLPAGDESRTAGDLSK